MIGKSLLINEICVFSGLCNGRSVTFPYAFGPFLVTAVVTGVTGWELSCGMGHIVCASDFISIAQQ